MNRRWQEVSAENSHLRQTLRRYETLLETVEGVVWEIDPRSQRTMFVGRKIKALLGYTPEEWMTTPHLWEACLHPDDQEQVLGATEAANQRGEPYELEYRAITAAGQAVWVRAHITPVVEAGVLTALRGVMSDITPLNLVGLQRQQAQAYALVQHSADVFSILNVEGRFTYVSPALKSQHGVEPETVLGWHFAAHMHRDDVGRAHADFQAGSKDLPGAIAISLLNLNH